MHSLTQEELKEKIWAMIKDIKVCLLITHSGSQLHARPMVAQRDKSSEQELWFFTQDDSSKIVEIMANPNVLLSYSEPKDQQYVSLSGTAEIIKDREQIKALWNEWLRTWFPQGPEQENIALIKVTPQKAEYWDSPSSMVVYAYGYVKARITGEMPDAGENATVQMA